MALVVLLRFKLQHWWNFRSHQLTSSGSGHGGWRRTGQPQLVLQREVNVVPLCSSVHRFGRHHEVRVLSHIQNLVNKIVNRQRQREILKRNLAVECGADLKLRQCARLVMLIKIKMCNYILKLGWIENLLKRNMNLCIFMSFFSLSAWCHALCSSKKSV